MSVSRPFRLPVLVAGCCLTAPLLPAQEPSPATATATHATADLRTTAATRAAILSARPESGFSDAQRLERVHDLAFSRDPDLRYVDVDQAQFDATLQGTLRLYQAIGPNPAGPPEYTLAVDSALEVSDNLYRAAGERGAIYPSDLDNARLAEKQMTLAYWERVGHQVPGRELTTRQISYVVGDRFHRLAGAAAAETGPIAEFARRNESFAGLLQEGEALAAALVVDTRDARAEKFHEFAISFARFTDRLQAGTLLLSDTAVIGLLTTAVDDTAQTVMYSMNLQAPIAVTVNTRREGNPEPGHLVRYELLMDYEIDSMQHLRFDTISSPSTHMLGPFHYYLWSEKDDQRTSEPQLFNLGDPLQATRVIDLAIRQPPPPEQP